MNDQHKYDNEVQPDNKFGHTLRLLDKHVPRGVPGGVHLDLACGFAHIAEPIVDTFGLHYIGVDVDDRELDSVRDRGLEAHAVDLTEVDVVEKLRKILDGRPLASVTFLDGLEHLTEGAHALRAVGDLIAEHRAVAVTSVPNVTHIDVGLKTLLGEWTYTEAGLLDETHYTLYSDTSLRRAMRVAGLQPFDEDNVVLARSDQHFPVDHVGLSESTPFSRWLREIRGNAEPHGLVNQFVWALTAVPPVPATEVETERSEVFLSLIMRTQGRRIQELREAMLCLAGQSCTDFEVVVVAHRTTVAEQKDIELVIEDQPAFLRDRIRLVLLDRGRRSTPLNVGIDQARGRYIAVFDDDDIVMGDWVKQFAEAERTHAGRVLRAITLRQPTVVNEVRGVRSVSADGSPTAPYSREFSLTEHLVENQSPPIGWVFPRSLVTDFGLRYDESMTTTEDWDFLLRAAELAGVSDLSRVTAVYRWWADRESSRTEHPVEEWQQNQAEIERRTDAHPFLLPPGETRILREELRELRALRKRVTAQDRRLEKLQARERQQKRKLQKLRKQLRTVRERNRNLRRRVGAPPGARRPAPPASGIVRARTAVRRRAGRLVRRARAALGRA